MTFLKNCINSQNRDIWPSRTNLSGHWDSRVKTVTTAYDSVTRDVLYTILIKFGVPMKLVRLIKMCLNEVHTGKHLADNVLIQNYLKQGDALSLLLFIVALE
jgi:hypothetical protein